MSQQEELAVGVVWPLGYPSVERMPAAARLPSLDGKRIAFVWDEIFRGDDMFGHFQAATSAQFEDVSFVTHEPFGNIHGSAQEEHDAVANVVSRLRQRRVDAALVGVGA